MILKLEIPTPVLIKLILRYIYSILIFITESLRTLYSIIVISPFTRSIITKYGKGLSIEKLPYIVGHGDIFFGDNVRISGKMGIAFSSHSKNTPSISIGNDTFIGHNSSFNISKKIIIGKECLIAGGVSIYDNDSHPISPDKRRKGLPIEEGNAQTVTLADGVWIGRNSIILKGVKIGENSIIGAGSIVTKSIPANCIAAGAPAKIIKKIDHT